MLNPGKLHEIAAFAACQCPVSAPNMEKARLHLTALLDFTAQLLEEDMRHLRLLEFKSGKEHNQDMYETVQNTLTQREEMYRALHNGRAR